MFAEYHPGPKRLKALLCGFYLMAFLGQALAQSRQEVLDHLRSLGNGSYLFGQMATWVHNENPDVDHPSNWIHKVHEHTSVLPGYGCITYDFADDPFPDDTWNRGVKKLWDRGILVGVYSFFANPSGGAWNDPCHIELIWAPGENAVKTNFYRQLDRMASNLEWLKKQGVVVVYTPFVESDDRNKWHAKQGSETIIQLYRLVRDYFHNARQLDNIIWAYHVTQNSGALQRCYPGDDYVDVLGKSAYGTGLVFSEYEWAVDKKQNHGKVIWWAELGIRDRSDPPQDCLRVLQKLETSFPELAGFVFWSDAGYFNVLGNLNGRELMTHPKIITLSGSPRSIRAVVQPATPQDQTTLTLSYESPNWLILHGDHVPGRHVRINYLEAYCRAGSTDADWVQHTVIPHRAELIFLSDDRKRLRLRDTLADGVTVDHTITARDDEVTFELRAHNPGSTRSEAHWAQPCVRLADFTGFDPRGKNINDYLPKCFIFLDGQLTRLSEVRPWATEGRYTPGQVWCPKGVPRSDVNPRPLSPLVPSNGLIGVFSGDERQIFATAWEPYQELFQGIIRCVHSDFRIGGLRPGETKEIKGRIYVVPNDVPALLARYARDFPEHQRASLDTSRGVTSLTNPDVQYSVPEKPYVVLQHGELEAVIVDNRAVNDTVLPAHAAGYHGIAALRHVRQSRNLFVPTYAGLNFEHIHDGTAKPREVLFEPRRAPMQLRVVNQHTAELYQRATPHWGLESCMRYELLPDGIMELTFECIPRRDTFGNGYIGLFWASYIDQPESLDIHFRGVPHPGQERPSWQLGVTPAHGTLATHRPLDDHRAFPHDPAFPLELPFGFSHLRYVEPWFFGVCRGMAWLQMFRPEDRVWLTQSPSGGGSGCPAWDFQWFIPQPQIDKRYQLIMRAAYVPLEHPDDLKSVRDQLVHTVSRSWP